MSENRAKNIQDMFDKISPKYDFLNRVLSFRRDVAWRKKSVKKLGINNSDAVLDLACGTGDMILTILKQAPECKITGGDFSVQMLKQASRKVTVPLVAADAGAMPFADDSFSKITIAFGFRNVVDKQKALHEMFRVLKNGGKLCILDFSSPKSKVFSKIYWFYFDKILPLIGRLISKHNAAYSYLPESVKHFPKDAEYKKMIVNAGFENVSFTAYDLGICTAAISEKPEK